MSLLTCRKIAVLKFTVFVRHDEKPKAAGAHLTSSEKASSVPGRTHTAVVESSGGPSPVSDHCHAELRRNTGCDAERTRRRRFGLPILSSRRQPLKFFDWPGFSAVTSKQVLHYETCGIHRECAKSTERCKESDPALRCTEPKHIARPDLAAIPIQLAGRFVDPKQVQPFLRNSSNTLG